MSASTPSDPTAGKGSLRFRLEPIAGGALDLWRTDADTPPFVPSPEAKGHSCHADHARARELAAALYDELKIPSDDSGWVDIGFASPKLPSLVAGLRDLLAREPLTLFGAHIVVVPTEAMEADAEWFGLYGWTEPQFRTFLLGEWRASLPEVPACKAEKAPPGVHVMARMVSERFKEVVEQHGFTGAEFFWLPDKGKYKAMQWYKLVPTQWLGRGLDHPWFDPATITGEVDQPTAPERRRGVVQFMNNQLKSGVAFAESWLNDFMRLCLPGQLELGFHMRHLRANLPDTDFALLRDGHLCMRRRVRDVLLRQGMIQAREAGALCIVDEAPAGVIVLDKAEDQLALPITAEEIRRVKETESRLWAAHLSKPKPAREASLDRSLKLMKAIKQSRPDEFGRKARSQDIAATAAALTEPMPAAWQQVLAVSEKFSFGDGEFEIVPLALLPEYQNEVRARNAGQPTEIPTRSMCFTRGLAGDFHCFDLETLKPDGDCRVLLISHETMSPEQQWPSIAEFIEDTFSAMAPPAA